MDEREKEKMQSKLERAMHIFVLVCSTTRVRLGAERSPRTTWYC